MNFICKCIIFYQYRFRKLVGLFGCCHTLKRLWITRQVCAFTESFLCFGVDRLWLQEFHGTNKQIKIIEVAVKSLKQQQMSRVYCAPFGRQKLASDDPQTHLFNFYHWKKIRQQPQFRAGIQNEANWLNKKQKADRCPDGQSHASKNRTIVKLSAKNQSTLTCKHQSKKEGKKTKTQNSGNLKDQNSSVHSKIPQFLLKKIMLKKSERKHLKQISASVLPQVLSADRLLYKEPEIYCFKDRSNVKNEPNTHQNPIKMTKSCAFRRLFSEEQDSSH